MFPETFLRGGVIGWDCKSLRHPHIVSKQLFGPFFRSEFGAALSVNDLAAREKVRANAWVWVSRI